MTKKYFLPPALAAILLCVGSFFATSTNKTAEPRKINVVFDLGGVVLDPSYASYAYHVGPLRFALGLGCVSPREIHERFFGLLSRIREQQENHSGAKDHKGNNLPQIMHDWMCNTQESSYDLRDQALAQIDNGDHDDYFRGTTERWLLRAMVNTTFTPETFTRTLRLHSAMVDFIAECKEQGHDLYIISNYNKESFECLRRTHPEFFNQFNGIIISHNVGRMKPDNRIFTEDLLTRFNLKAEDCIFIDDQPENCAAAQRCNIASIVCEKLNKKPNVQEVASQFEQIVEHKLRSI